MYTWFGKSDYYDIYGDTVLDGQLVELGFRDLNFLFV